MPTPFLLNGILASQISGHLYSGPTGAFDALGSVTVGSGGQSSITFSAIPQTYTHLQIRFTAQTNRGTYAIDDIRVRFNGDTGSHYADHLLVGGGSSASAYADSSATSIVTGVGNIVTNNISNTFGVGVIDILDYGNTNKYKTLRALVGGDYNATGASGYYPSISLSSGLWLGSTGSSTEAINSINLYPEYGSLFTQYSNFSLYGIR